MTHDFNDDDARDLLARAVPPAPVTDGWADQVKARRGRSRMMAGLLALALVAVIPFGVFHLTREAGTQVGGAGLPLVEPGTEVVATGSLFQDGAEPMICFAMADSLPPQCAGPILAGEFSWNDVEHEEAGGVRWTEVDYLVQGTFDPAAGGQGTITLTAAPTAAQYPDGAVGDETLDFPQLCDDPLRGGDSALTGIEAENSIHEVLASYDVVDIWVSNGRDAYNVLVRGDAEEVHTAVREVWGGQLCVSAASGASTAEVLSAVERIFEALPPGVAQYGGPMGQGSGAVDLGVVYLDEEGLRIIRGAKGSVPVRITTLLTPVGATSVVHLE